jgi:hypothetical protein
MPDRQDASSRDRPSAPRAPGGRIARRGGRVGPDQDAEGTSPVLDPLEPDLDEPAIDTSAAEEERRAICSPLIRSSTRSRSLRPGRRPM